MAVFSVRALNKNCQLENPHRSFAFQLGNYVHIKIILLTYYSLINIIIKLAFFGAAIYTRKLRPESAIEIIKCSSSNIAHI